jgi:hypothetical protein
LRLALGSALATASAAAGMKGKDLSPLSTSTGTFSDDQRSGKFPFV